MEGYDHPVFGPLMTFRESVNALKEGEYNKAIMLLKDLPTDQANGILTQILPTVQTQEMHAAAHHHYYYSLPQRGITFQLTTQLPRI